MSDQSVPAYWLYGERRTDRFPDALHIETIVSRSTLHDWRIEPHRHQSLHQFFLIARGGGTARIDGVDHRLAPGTAVLMPPLHIHEFRFERSTDGFVASIAELGLRRLFDAEADAHNELMRPAVFGLGLDDTEYAELAGVMQAALTEFARNQGGREVALTAHAGLIALWFWRAIRRVRADSAPRRDGHAALVGRFIECVEADFRSHRPLEDYARRLGVSVPHLSRTCRETLGLSAVRVIHDRMMLEARRHLVYTSMPVSQIAFALGFSDPAYFSRFFAARAGVAPSDYRAAA